MMYLDHPISDVMDRTTGELASPDKVVQCHLKDMAAMYEDSAAAQAAVAAGNPLLYKVYVKEIPELPGELQWCMSVLLPGKIGREYYMTKGHYHAVRETAEIYLCVRGTGYMLMETKEGQTDAQPMKPDVAVYVPAHWAHRSINTGDEPLISFCVYPGNAGHDYDTIREEGFRKRIVEIDGRPAIIDR